MINEITPTELKARLDANVEILVIDVRQPWELEVSTVDFTTHIEMTQIPQHINEIPKDKPIVLMCRSGVRSMKVAEFLSRSGWPSENLLNLEGGILAWAQEIDPTLPENY
jgi:adenylyltransferase/sulfurtransferase